LQGYLFDPAAADAAEGLCEALLFSGGLDALGGAVQEVVQGRRKVALVSHRPAPSACEFTKTPQDAPRLGAGRGSNSGQ
jgi:hypothetical protein